MTVTVPGKVYSIETDKGVVHVVAIRTRNHWNDPYTGKFLCYNQHVKKAWSPVSGGNTIRYKIYCPRCGNDLTIDRKEFESRAIINERVTCKACKVGWLVSLHGRRITYEINTPTLDLFLKSIGITD